MNIQQPRCTIIADFTAEPLANALLNDGLFPAIESVVAPLGPVQQSLMRLQTEQTQPKPDLVIVWSRPEATIPSFRALLRHERVEPDQLLDEVDQFVDLLLDAAEQAEYLFIPTWTIPYYRRGGLLSMHPEVGCNIALMRMNLRVAERLQSSPNAFQLDASRWLAAVGKNASNPKLWLMGKIAFGSEVLGEASADIKAGLCGLAGLSKKLVVLDLDDTLWGGIVGEVGWERLRLGGHDSIGEAHVELQEALKALTRTGVVLGIVSKNDEATALAAIDRHPEMVLRRTDFAGWRINWNDKAANLVDLADELNLGLDSVVFIDDSPAERARVREALPQVTVPDWPSDKLLYASRLTEMRLFDRGMITAEDLDRTDMYVADRERIAAKRSFPSMDEWLASLAIVVRAARLDETNLARAAQLFNKTNQLTLTTRRRSERELLQWSRQPEHDVFVFRVCDRFGDYGLTGLAGLEMNDDRARITDFVMSCRVMGRGVEETILHTIVARARDNGAGEVEAVYAPTDRNKPMLEFLENHSQLSPDGSGVRFTWDANQDYPSSPHVDLQIDCG